jgi:hypothetical protein
MTSPTVRYEFSYTTIATGVPSSFAIGNIADDVAAGIKAGLQGVTTISAVNAVEVSESRAPVS